MSACGLAARTAATPAAAAAAPAGRGALAAMLLCSSRLTFSQGSAAAKDAPWSAASSASGAQARAPFARKSTRKQRAIALHLVMVIVGTVLAPAC